MSFRRLTKFIGSEGSLLRAASRFEAVIPRPEGRGICCSSLRCYRRQRTLCWSYGCHPDGIVDSRQKLILLDQPNSQQHLFRMRWQSFSFSRARKRMRSKPFRMTFLHQMAKQLPWNDILTKKGGGGRGCFKYHFKFSLLQTAPMAIYKCPKLSAVK